MSTDVGCDLEATFGALASALPHTDQEDQLIGSAADKIKKEAGHIAGDLYEQGKDKAGALYEDAKDTVAKVYADTKSTVAGSLQPTDRSITH